MTSVTTHVFISSLFHSKVHFQCCIQCAELIEKSRQQPMAGHNVFSAAHFSDRMHRVLWHTDIDSANATIGRQNGTDGAAAQGVVAYTKILNGNLVPGIHTPP
jgi:hypothetical protein